MLPFEFGIAACAKRKKMPYSRKTVLIAIVKK
jgi:hypothetical protein